MLKLKANGQDAICIIGINVSVHLLHKRTGYGQSEAGGMVGGFDGEETIEQLRCCDAVEICGVVGKGDNGISRQMDA